MNDQRINVSTSLDSAFLMFAVAFDFSCVASLREWTKDHWQVPWLLVAIRRIEIRWRAQRPCSNLQSACRRLGTDLGLHGILRGFPGSVCWNTGRRWRLWIQGLDFFGPSWEDEKAQCRVGKRSACHDGNHWHVFPGLQLFWKMTVVVSCWSLEMMLTQCKNYKSDIHILQVVLLAFFHVCVWKKLIKSDDTMKDGLTGSAWGDWANYTASPLRAFENELGVQAPTGFWDPAGFTADGSVENFKRRRQTELKHGRISMLATMGYITPEQLRSARKTGFTHIRTVPYLTLPYPTVCCVTLRYIASQYITSHNITMFCNIT